MNYTDKQLDENYNKFIALLKSKFSGDRLKKLLHLYDENEFGLRLITAPASAKEHYHNAYIGGYLDHILNVYKASIGTMKGATIDFTEEEMCFSALHHDLGKLGDKVDGDYYLTQDSDWHLKNKGEMFKFNPKLQYMDVTDRALFTLQQYEIKCSWKETLAIKLSDGLYHEPNASYLKGHNKDYELKTNLPRVIHAADYLACRQEYDTWKEENV